MLVDGWITELPDDGGDARRRRYRLSARGRRVAQAEAQRLDELVRMARDLRAPSGARDVNAGGWLELALLAYPADFRAEFREQILADLEDERAGAVSAAADIVGTGLRMRADGVARDVGFGVRRLRRLPLLVGVVVATFALGIGANVAVFSVLDAVLIKPLPYPNAARLAVVESHDRRGVVGNALSIPDVGDLRAARRSSPRSPAKRKIPPR